MSTSPGLPGIYCSSLIQGMSLPSLQEEELSPTDCSEDSVEIKPRPILFNKTLRLRPFPPMLTETAYGSCPTGSSTTSTSKRKLQAEELRRPVCEEKKRRISGSEEEEIPLSPTTPKPLTAIGDLFLPSPSPPTTAYLPPGYMVPHPHHFPLASLLRLTPTNTQSCLPTTNAEYLTNHDHQQRALVNQYVLARLNASLPWPPSAAYARHPFPPLAPNWYHPHALGYLHPPISHGMGLYPPLPNLYNNSTGVSFIPPPSPTQPHNPHHFPLPNHLPILNPSLIKHPLTQSYHPPVSSSLREDTHKDLNNLRTSPCSPQLSPTVSRPRNVPSPSPLQQPLSLVKQSVSLSGIQCEVVQEDQRVKPGEPSVQQNSATSTPVTSISRKLRKERKTSKLGVKPSNEVIKEVDTQRFTREDKGAPKPDEIPNTPCSTLLLPVKKRSAFFSVETLLGNDSSATKLETVVKEEPGTLPPRPPSAAASTSVEQFVAHVQQVVPSNVPSPRVASPDGRTKHRNYKNMTRERRMEANARERTRVHTISAAFENLRRAVPSFSHGQRLSKLSILRVAASYILALSKLSTDSEGDTSSETDALPSLASCVDLCTRTLTTEGQLRRKREDRTNEDSDDDL